jgi:arsenate reductase
MTTTIYHNPRCSKSRETLELLRQHDAAPEIVLYLDTPPDAGQIEALLGMLGFGDPRQLMRTKEAEYAEQGLDDPSISRAQLIAAMVATPKLIERPIVVRNGRAAVGRPPENILALFG